MGTALTGMATYLFGSSLTASLACWGMSGSCRTFTCVSLITAVPSLYPDEASRRENLSRVSPFRARRNQYIVRRASHRSHSAWTACLPREPVAKHRVWSVDKFTPSLCQTFIMTASCHSRPSPEGDSPGLVVCSVAVPATLNCSPTDVGVIARLRHRDYGSNSTGLLLFSLSRKASDLLDYDVSFLLWKCF